MKGLQTGLDWEEAERYLNVMIDAYIETGPAGAIALTFFILPLRQRYEGGERTQDLYDSIMEIE